MGGSTASSTDPSQSRCRRPDGAAVPRWTIDPRELASRAVLRRDAKMELPEDARHYLDLAGRHFDREVGGERISPSRFIEWAHGIGLRFHPDWTEAIAHAQPDTPPAQPPGSDADRLREALIKHWARSPYWSITEGVVLAHNLDPDVAIVRSVSGYDDPRIRGSASARHFLDLAERAVDVGKLDEQPAPRTFMHWARSIGVEFHRDWWNAVADEAAPTVEEGDPEHVSTAVPELKTRERESLLKLVVGMAIGGYSWDPVAPRSDATADISSDLDSAGVHLDPDTIRKWLRQGAELLPRDT